MLNNWAVTIRLLSPQLINICLSASATEYVALRMCMYGMHVRIYVHAGTPASVGM